MFWSCCGLGRRRSRRDSEEPDETTRLLATSDALFPQVQEALKPIDDAALLEYRRRIDRILEETAEKLVSVSNASQHPLTHIHSNSSSAASTSTAKASGSTSSKPSHSRGHDSLSTATTNGRDTLWRAEGPSGANDSIHSMKKASKSSKARGKEVAREVDAGLPNEFGDVSSALTCDDEDDDKSQQQQGQRRVQEEHDRDATMASYKTANEAEEDEDTEESESAEGSEDAEGSVEDDSSSDAPSKRDQRRIGQSHDRSKKPRAVQDIFQDDSLTQSKPQDRLQKALALSDEDFSRQLTHL